MRITPYRQTILESCLPVCLLLISGQRIFPEIEVLLLVDGLKSFREIYSLGILIAFTKKYKFFVEVKINNKFFWKYLNKSLYNNQIHLVHQPIKSAIPDQKFPYILYVDGYGLGMNTHSPHFVIIESQKDEYFNIIDSWIGKRRKIKREIIFQAIDSLKKHLRICPLLITVKSRLYCFAPE